MRSAIRLAGALEVHEHSFVSGPRAARIGSHVSHSHAGGGRPHSHPNTGPCTYTIDKDDWLRATGLRGGGRKKFTATPEGEQLQLVEREPKSFEVIICAPTPGNASGPGVAPIARMVLGSRMDFEVKERS